LVSIQNLCIHKAQTFGVTEPKPEVPPTACPQPPCNVTVNCDSSSKSDSKSDSIAEIMQDLRKLREQYEDAEVADLKRELRKLREIYDRVPQGAWSDDCYEECDEEC